MFERCMIGLHAAAAAALALIAIVSLLFGSRFELLTLNAGPGPWVWLGAWLLLSLLIAGQRRPVAGWRLGLGACSVLFGVTAVLGLLRRAPLALPVGATLLLLAAGAGALALAIDESRVLAVRGRRRALAGAPTRRPSGVGRTARRASDAGRWRVRAATAIAWGLCALSFCVFFAWAQARSGGRVEAAGHAGMLLVFFVLVPGAGGGAWFPRAFAAIWLLSAGSMSWLALRVERPALLALALAVALCAVARLVRGGGALPEKVPA